MLRCKDTKNLKELLSVYKQESLTPSNFLRVFKAGELLRVLKSQDSVKTKGTPISHLITLLIAFSYLNIENINCLIRRHRENTLQSGKDAFYRLMSNERIDWRTMLWGFVASSLRLINTRSSLKAGSTLRQNVKCLIIDDTLLQKTGKTIEGVSFVFDHVTRRMVLGFKALVAAYWDGFSIIPVDFSLHREKGKNSEKPYGFDKKSLRRLFNYEREPDSAGSTRKTELNHKKTESAIAILKRAVKHKLNFSYVLVDSWFTSILFLNAVRSVNKGRVHLIGMLKDMSRRVVYNHKQLSLRDVFVSLPQITRSRKNRLHYKQAQVRMEGHTVNIFFTRQGINGKWKMILSSDLSLSFNKVFEIYQIRWTIEVMFRESKQLFQIGSCQSNNLDHQIAHITISLFQHILLTILYRFEAYESRGLLFESVENQMDTATLADRIYGLLIELVQIISEYLEMDAFDLVKNMLNDTTAVKSLNRILRLVDEAA